MGSRSMVLATQSVDGEVCWAGKLDIVVSVVAAVNGVKGRERGAVSTGGPTGAEEGLRHGEVVSGWASVLSVSTSDVVSVVLVVVVVVVVILVGGGSGMGPPPAGANGAGLKLLLLLLLSCVPLLRPSAVAADASSWSWSVSEQEKYSDESSLSRTLRVYLILGKRLGKGLEGAVGARSMRTVGCEVGCRGNGVKRVLRDAITPRRNKQRFTRDIVDNGDNGARSMRSKGYKRGQ